MQETIETALKTALKAKEKHRVSTLRLILAAFKDRKIALRTEGVDTLSDKETQVILLRMIKQREESCDIYAKAGRAELAEQESNEIEIIRDFLPPQLEEADIRAAVEAVISELNASGLKDIGRIMGALKERHAGEMDFAKASGLVKQLLS